MSQAEEKTKFLLTYKFKAYPSALLEYRMENWLYILHNLYNHNKKKLSKYNPFTFFQVWMKQKGKLVEVIRLKQLGKTEEKNR